MRPDDQRSGQRWRRGRDPDPDGVALAATVAAGVLLGGCAAVAAGTHATPLAVLLALAAAGLAAMPLSEAAERPVLAGAMVLVTLATTGAAVAAMRVAGTSGGLLPRLAATPGRGVAVTGTVVEEPRTVQYGARLVVLRVDRVTTAGRTWRTRERAAVVFGRDAAPSVSTVAVGDQLRLHAGVAPAAHPSRIGVSDQAPVTLRRPHLEAWAPSRSRLLRSSEAFRAAARGSARASLPPEHAGLLVGMALGDTSLLSPTLDRVFKDAGLSHLLAASGENLAVLLAAGLGLAAALGAGRPSLAAVGVLLTIAFALLTRWEPSVLRASVMAALVLAGVATGRGPGGRRALCLAVMFLLLANPSLAATLGFQLSVAATAGVLGLGPANRPRAAPVAAAAGPRRRRLRTRRPGRRAPRRRAGTRAALPRRPAREPPRAPAGDSADAPRCGCRARRAGRPAARRRGLPPGRPIPRGPAGRRPGRRPAPGRDRHPARPRPSAASHHCPGVRSDRQAMASPVWPGAGGQVRVAAIEFPASVTGPSVIAAG